MRIDSWGHQSRVPWSGQPGTSPGQAAALAPESARETPRLLSWLVGGVFMFTWGSSYVHVSRSGRTLKYWGLGLLHGLGGHSSAPNTCKRLG